MHDEHIDAMRLNYNSHRSNYIENPSQLIELEQRVTNLISEIITANWHEFKRDFDEASRNFPLWANHSPRDRGRDHLGDQTVKSHLGEFGS